jgi:carbamate kinase
MNRRRIVVALGGNALLARGEPMDVQTQLRHVRTAARAVAALAEDSDLVITHGNGPQVGLLALQAEAYHDVPPYPLDVLGAESEGMIGYLLAQAIEGELPELVVAPLLTQMIVDGTDPAFANPTKPVGPIYSADQARLLAKERGWTVAPDGDHFRRVVPSPEPREVVELRAIRTLVDQGALVICVGGGGIPVVADQHGLLHGVEAVIDKDRSAALLAEQLSADFLLMLTDVRAVVAGWRTPEERPIGHTTPDELAAMDFAAGSMGPKVQAACRFVDATGGRAAIGSLADAAAIVRGEAGTTVSPSVGSAATTAKVAAGQG